MDLERNFHFAALVPPNDLNQAQVLREISATSLSGVEALNAMKRLLFDYYQRMGKDAAEIGVILGQMTIDADGITFDPAWTYEWLAAIRAVKEGDIIP